jgi:uncharacterized membrane protein
VVNAYGVLKFLHVLSVIVWVGGVTSVALLTWRIAREHNRAVLVAVLRQAMAYVQWVVGPASGIVLLSGLTMVWLANLGFTTTWVWFGYGGVVVQAVVGGFLLRKRVTDLSRIVAQPTGDDTALIVAARRLWNAQLIYLALLGLVVAGMVLKPTF